MCFSLLTHAPLYAHLPLYIVLRVCYFGGMSPQWVQTLPGWLGTTQLQTQTGARPLLSVHRTAPALNSLAVFLQHCTEPWEVWEPTGQVCGCGQITQQKRLYLRVISAEVVVRCCAALCECVAEWSLAIHAVYLANSGKALWSSV